MPTKNRFGFLVFIWYGRFCVQIPSNCDFGIFSTFFLFSFLACMCIRISKCAVSGVISVRFVPSLLSLCPQFFTFGPCITIAQAHTYTLWPVKSVIRTFGSCFCFLYQRSNASTYSHIRTLVYWCQAESAAAAATTKKSTNKKSQTHLYEK